MHFSLPDNDGIESTSYIRLSSINCVFVVFFMVLRMSNSFMLFFCYWPEEKYLPTFIAMAKHVGIKEFIASFVQYIPLS